MVIDLTPDGNECTLGLERGPCFPLYRLLPRSFGWPPPPPSEEHLRWRRRVLDWVAQEHPHYLDPIPGPMPVHKWRFMKNQLLRWLSLNYPIEWAIAFVEQRGRDSFDTFPCGRVGGWFGGWVQGWIGPHHSSYYLSLIHI